MRWRRARPPEPEPVEEELEEPSPVPARTRVGGLIFQRHHALLYEVTGGFDAECSCGWLANNPHATLPTAKAAIDYHFESNRESE